MKNPFNSKELAESMRRRIELAIAVAQERLLATHVDHALGLIQVVGDQVPFENALGIYTRLLRLSEDEARVITTRALAILGERAAETESWPELITAAEIEEAEEDSGRFMRIVRQRLRGRVNEDLRKFVELTAARTEVAILNTHVENALNFVELLEKDMSFNEAVELYLESLEVRESVAEVAYYLTLARLSEKHLPKLGAFKKPPAVPEPVTRAG